MLTSRLTSLHAIGLQRVTKPRPQFFQRHILFHNTCSLHTLKKTMPLCHFFSKFSTSSAHTEPKQVETSYINDQSRLKWLRRPQKVLIVRKNGCDVSSDLAIKVAKLLHKEDVEPFVDLKDYYLNNASNPIPYCTPFDFHMSDKEGITKPAFDFTICIGGDGTLLHYSSLYRTEAEPIPPVMSLGLGTLGFMTLDPQDWENWIRHLLAADGNQGNNSSSIDVFCTNKDRLRCNLKKKERDGPSKIWLASGSGSEWRANEVFYCLNEFVMDRGVEMMLNKLRLYIDGLEVTTVEADGLIVCTPAGSTGYNLSAGGSMMSPHLPCISVTPIAPHTLSFRPIVISVNSHIEIGVMARRVERGDRVVITKSSQKLPVLSFQRPDAEWYNGLTQKLGWNSGRRIRGIRI